MSLLKALYDMLEEGELAEDPFEYATKRAVAKDMDDKKRAAIWEDFNRQIEAFYADKAAAQTKMLRRHIRRASPHRY